MLNYEFLIENEKIIKKLLNSKSDIEQYNFYLYLSIGTTFVNNDYLKCIEIYKEYNKYTKDINNTNHLNYNSFHDLLLPIIRLNKINKIFLSLHYR